MYARSVVFRSISIGFFLTALVTAPALAGQQAPAPGHEQHQQPAPPQEDHTRHAGHGPGTAALFSPRDASGTAWLPEATPMYALHQQLGAWQLMWHGNGFVQFLYEGGERGSTQAGSINWVMGMARREVRGGRLGFRGMLSMESWTIPGCGYPDLLATGEVCDGEAIHDRQHPHDLVMELVAEYDRPLSSSLRWQFYGGPAGEPALGPVAFPHRLSAMPNPLAPTSHHWLDATHITFGVVTGAVYGSTWKAEASAFNGREPDEHRADLDLAALDSVAGRLSFAPTPSLALQVSAGRLEEAEGGPAGEPRTSVDRVTASATYHRALRAESLWATTVAWGRNEEESGASHAFLLESTLTLEERDVWFGRIDVGGKPAHDLDIHGTDEVFTVAKLQAGYTRYLQARSGLRPGFGASISASIVPPALSAAYGHRVNLGIGLFVTMRPAAHR